MSTPPPPPATSPPIKRCGCGLAYGPGSWACLRFVTRADLAGDGEVLEMRDCLCGSTIALPVCAETGMVIPDATTGSDR